MLLSDAMVRAQLEHIRKRAPPAMDLYTASICRRRFDLNGDIAAADWASVRISGFFSANWRHGFWDGRRS
ncbi:hypothetical protein CO676_20625 [Sinorhizobium sp. BJ1]|nr:hypothetical protein CO676_20625 [Sinorhizobium sp. BJ1]